MYTDFFGFREKPFSLTPDPKYLYLSPRHTEAFAHLEFGRRERGGFIVITGEVGTGKTTLARYFLSRLDARTATAFVLYPALSAAELLRATLEDLHIPVTGQSLKDHVDALHRFLLASAAQGQVVMLLIDEAQDLSAEVLEQVRLISNLETDTEKLIQIVLMGQSELQDLLARRELRQLAQRVTTRYHLSPLNRTETEAYIRHRLMVAGGEGKVTFTSGALSVVHRRSGGVPRLINLICDRALLAAYVAGVRVVEAHMVRRAAHEVRGNAPWMNWRVAASVAAVGIGLAAAGAVLLSSRAPAGTPPPLRAPATLPSIPPATQAPALGPLLLGLPSDASFNGALAAVQNLWGSASLERTPMRTYLEQVRLLDLPVVLEMFHPARRDASYLALLRLSGNEAVVFAGGAERTIDVAEVDRLWTRRAVFLWRDFDAIAHAGEATFTAWTRAELSRQGYTDPNLASAVGRFQRKTELAADGVVGNRTLMTLYSMGAYRRPRLRTGGLS